MPVVREVRPRTLISWIGMRSVVAADAELLEGANDRIQLAALERRYRRLQSERLMRAGVTLADPERFDLRGRAEVGRDIFIDVNVVLIGEVVLGDDLDTY